MRASWGAAVAGRVNELCAMAPSGVLQREGFGGMGAQPLPANLRNRRASAGRPMPFDLKAEIETSQDGTQQRLVVKWYATDASVCWNYWPLDPPSETPDEEGWVTLYSGSYAAIGELDEYVVAELWYTLQVSSDWSSSPPSFSATGEWSVEDNSDEDYTDESFAPAATPAEITSYVSLGTVEASASGVIVTQTFRGNLHLHDLLVGSSDATIPTPFQYKVNVSESDGEESGEESQATPTVTYTITNCRFYWDGEYHTLSDFEPPATGTVYLVATKSGSGEGSWSFALSTTPGGSEGSSASASTQSVKLYDFVNHTVTMDYRTTTLMFGPGPRDYFEVKKPDGSVKAALDATGTSAKATIEGATHDVIIDAADATQGDVELRECDYYAPGEETPEKVVILSSATSSGDPMRLGIGKTITLSEALDNIVTS